MSQFDHRMKVSPSKTVVIERDEKRQTTLNDAVPQFISDMDVMLKQIGIEFGQQWLRLSKGDEIETTYTVDEKEVG